MADQPDPGYAAFVARLTAPEPARKRPPQPVVDWQAVAHPSAQSRFPLRHGRRQG